MKVETVGIVILYKMSDTGKIVETPPLFCLRKLDADKETIELIEHELNSYHPAQQLELYKKILERLGTLNE